MAFGKNPVTTTQGALPNNQIFPSSVYVPNHANGDLTALRGANPSTDNNQNESADVSVAVPDGNDITQGSKADAAVVNPALSASEISLLKGLVTLLSGTLGVSGTVAVSNLPGTQPVSGSVSVSNFPATQPISAASLPLPSGAALEAGHLANLDTHTPALGQASKAFSSPVVLASDQGDLFVKGDFTEIAGLSAGNLNVDLVPSTDVSAYKWLSLHINTSAYSGVLSFQASDDGVNFPPIFLENTAATNALSSTTAATNAIFTGPVNFRYFRVRMTGYTSGTAQATLELYTQSPAPRVTGAIASQNGTWTMQPGNTPNTTPWLISQSNNNFSVPTGAGNTVIKPSAGPIATIYITATGTGTGNVQIFDSPTTNAGTVLAAFPANATVGQSFPVYGWAKTGMTAQNVASGPVFTVYFA